MKVLGQNLNNISTPKATKNNTAFRGNIATTEKMMKDIYQNSGKFSRFLMKIGQNDGEILNTIVTAVGTAAVAPIFIAFNPFSKEDKETKIYSAMRQPISAIIALIMQISVNKGFNNYMNKKASTGGFDRADLRAKPKASYLQRIIKLEHPEYTKEEIATEVSARQLAAEKKMIDKYRISMKDIDLGYEKLISKDSLDTAKAELTKEVKVQHAQELANMNPKEAKSFMAQHVSVEKIEERAIKNIAKEVSIETATKSSIRGLAKKYNTVDEALEFMRERQKVVTANPNARAVTKQTAKNIIEKLEIIKEYESTNHKTPFSSVKDLGKNAKEIEHNIKIKKFVKAQVSDAEKVLGKYTKLLGIIVSLLTLPISCGLLNWAYPRIMEKIMPNVSKKKNEANVSPQKTGGDK